MLFDILIVFVVSLISSLCLCTTSLHALPTSSSSSSAAHYIHSPPSADLSSSLRLFHHQPVPSVDYDLGGDISEMLIGESNELSPMNNQDDDDSSAAAAASPSSFASSLDASNEPLDVYLQPMPSQSLSRKLFLSAKHHLLNRNEEEEDEKDHPRKRFSSPSISGAPSLPTQLNLHSAYADPSNSNGVANINRLSESTRLTPSLQLLVETNPFARAWLTLLLQKVMEEQHVPYIFKYGRRRK